MLPVDPADLTAELTRHSGVIVDDLLLAFENQMDVITQFAAEGRITISQWEAQMRTLIKRSHNSAAIVAREGEKLGLLRRVQTWVERQRTIREEFRYLERFADELRSGKYDSETMLGRVRARARMYANKARTSYEDVRQWVLKRTGAVEKRRVLGLAEHCEDCMAEAGLGWVDINDPRVTLPGAGATRCLSNCKCTLEYRTWEDKLLQG